MKRSFNKAIYSFKRFDRLDRFKYTIVSAIQTVEGVKFSGTMDITIPKKSSQLFITLLFSSNLKKNFSEIFLTLIIFFFFKSA